MSGQPSATPGPSQNQGSHPPSATSHLLSAIGQPWHASPARGTQAREPGRGLALKVGFGVLLALLLVLGGVLRLAHINWDQFQQIHPDERFIVWTADTMSWPPDLQSALDPARSTIDPFRWPAKAGDLAGKPRGYAYGHFPLYLLFGVAHLASAAAEWMGSSTIAFPAILQPAQVLGRHLAEYDYLPLVGRALSTFCDLLTVLLVFALGRRAFGRTAGLLGAAAYTIAVLPVQLSHFYAVDLVLTFCVVATVALAARWAERGGWGTWLLAGAMAGLAVGSKFSAVLLAVPLLAANLCRLPEGRPARKVGVVLGRLVATGGVGLVVFALTNPFALIEGATYLSNILAQQAMVSGVMDAPYTRQYVGTLPYLYFVQQLSQWGLGWPLGLVAWGGLIWLLIRALRRRASAAQIVILAWALPYLLVTGAFHTKFLRYMAPLLPFLLICGAGSAVAAWNWLAGRWGRPGRIAWAAAVAVVTIVSVGWTMAFTGVYRQEHPWIRASRWIYENVPAGSKLLTEHWDDALPLTMGEITNRPPPREYQRVELPLYDPDTEEKLDGLVAELSSADYVVIASNRLYGPIGRLTMRYPMSSQYYRLLFEGGLGYRKVAEFSAYPNLAGVVVRDDHADESFTVYDHPRAMVFANEERLKPELLRARLARYLPLSSQRSTRLPGHARYAPPPRRPGALARSGSPGPLDAAGAGGTGPGQSPEGAPPLTLAQPVNTLPVVADFRWNRFASEWPPAAILSWWLVLSLFGWLTWPLIFPLMGKLSDRGYGLARAIGWLLIGWVHWIGVSIGLWSNRTPAIAALLALLAVAGFAAWRVQRRRIAAFWAERRQLLLIEEMIFGLAFLAFVFLRLLNPDLWQPWNGGEKFMESAFLNAILRSPFFPPYDPYFAGGYINYYYFGLYMVSLPIKLTGIVPEVAFNLAVPGLFALTASVLSSIGFSLARDDETTRTPGRGTVFTTMLGLALALLLGNLAGFRELLRGLDRLGDGLAHLGQLVSGAYDYWAPSRVIPYTINEFPFWTFLFADLHPHLIAIPFGMLLVGLSLNWLLSCEERDSGYLQDLLNVLLLALSLGAMGVINTWDLPSYFLLLFGTFLLIGWRKSRLAALVANILTALVIGALAVIAYWPFYSHYRSPAFPATAGGIFDNTGEMLLTRYLGWTRSASPLGDWLLVWGIFLFLAYSFTLWELRRRPQGHADDPTAQAEADVLRSGRLGAPAWPGRNRAIGLLTLVALAASVAVLERPTAALAAVPLALALVLALRRWALATEAFLNILLALGLGILAGVELVYVRDFLAGGDWYRMNTVFKFSVPAWLFMGVALGAMLGRRWDLSRSSGAPALSGGHGRLGLKAAWSLLATALLVAGFVFLVFGTSARVKDRFPGRQPAIGTLDGTAYMTVGKYTWPDPEHEIELAYDYQAIHWMLDHIQGTPVVAEAPAGGYEVNGQFQGYDYYRAGGLRVSSLTGFPTFVGQHQNEQRPGEQVSKRTELGQEFFRSADIAQATELIEELNVEYIYVGALERILFPQAGLDKFDSMVESGDLVVAYHNPTVTIYQVNASMPK